MGVQFRRIQLEILCLLIWLCALFLSLKLFAKVAENIKMKAFISSCTFLLLALHLTQGCPWMQHKFAQHSRRYLSLLEEMGEKLVEDRVRVRFPDDLYRLVRKSHKSEKIMQFIAQVLDEVSLLLDEDLNAVAWDKTKMEEFMGTLNTQLEKTQSCVRSHTKENKRLHQYFEKLRIETLGKMENKTQAWELIRKEVHCHLIKIDLMASTRL